MLTDPNRRSFFWKLGVTAAVLALSIGVSVFVAVRLAIARDGVAGGPARSYVTVAGTVTGQVGNFVQMQFTFHRRGSTTVLCAPTVNDVAVRSGGAFVAQVPLDSDAGAEALCPSNLFDGSDTEVGVSVNGIVVAPDVAINPVPYAHYASQYGTPDCPVGYERDMSEPDIRLCRKCRGPGRLENCYDNVVRVGSGATAFWIDRFEATVWPGEFGSIPTAEALGLHDELSYGSAGLPANGQWRTTTRARPPVHAESIPYSGGPSAYITWFQASESCAASGKRLPTGEEWLRAAQGTPDPPTPVNGGSFAEPRCNTGGSTPHSLVARGEPADPGSCMSAWGAHDMVGNLWEWTAEWYVSVANREDGIYTALPVWPSSIPSYNDDRTWNIRSGTNNGTMDRVMGSPAAALHGGSFLEETRGGIFALFLGHSPSKSDRAAGFRCVIPR